MRRFVILVLAGWLLSFPLVSQDGDYTVLSNWKNHNDRWLERNDGGLMLFRRLNERAFELLDRRDREVALIRTAEGWKARRAYVRTAIGKMLGPWPGKTPLNARTTGAIERDGYRIEKLVYESLPGFHITGALYVPDPIGEPRPAILYIPGHTNNGFRSPGYQNECINLVKKGFVVLTYDPIGQGERHQEVDPVTGERFVTTRQVPHYKMHSYAGNQCFLSGVSLSRYFIWDAIRGIDYLVSRPEVDRSRIGITGLSGGGNLTAYTGAVDERIKVAVPACFVTSYRRLLALNGIQDAEQNVMHGLRYGIEHADWLLARAPKPTLLLTTTHDFFPIQGARETEAAMHRVYAAMGEPENFDRVEDDHGHGYTPQNSAASYAFLMKHLGLTGDPSWHDYPTLSDEALRVTDSGQVTTEFRGETIFSINRKETAGLLEKVERARGGEGHISAVLESARDLSGYREPAVPDDAVYRGGFPRTGYRIEKHALDGGRNAVIPMLLALPDSEGPHPAVVYLHPDGKEAGLGSGGPVEELVGLGYAVLAPDLIGIGETAPRIGRQNDRNAAFYEGALIGSSVVGLQAEDVTRVVAWLQTEDRIQADGIGLAAHGSLGPTAIHAAAFNPEIRWLVLERSLATWASVAMNRFYTIPTGALVPGALAAYDLPDLLASLSPRRIAVLGASDEKEKPLDAEAAREAYRFTVSRYAGAGAGAQFRILGEGEAKLGDLVGWCAR